MSAPVRSPAHLAFIRSLPCAVCALLGSLNQRHIEAAHTPGSRGMGQKRSDLDTIPLCRTHHQAQHAKGWPWMIQKYSIDVQEALGVIRTRPRISVLPIQTNCRIISVYVADYRGDSFQLLATHYTLDSSLGLLPEICRESLIETYFKPLAERSRKELRERVS